MVRHAARDVGANYQTNMFANNDPAIETPTSIAGLIQHPGRESP
jgi:hypothetical protein